MTTLCRAIVVNIVFFAIFDLFQAAESIPRRGDIEVIGALSSSNYTIDTLKEITSGEDQQRDSLQVNIKGDGIDNDYQRISTEKNVASDTLSTNKDDNGCNKCYASNGVEKCNQSRNYSSSRSEQTSSSYSRSSSGTYSSSQNGYKSFSGSLSSSQSGSTSSSANLNANFTINPLGFGQNGILSSDHSESFSSSHSSSNSTSQSESFVSSQRSGPLIGQSGGKVTNGFYGQNGQIIPQNNTDRSVKELLQQEMRKNETYNMSVLRAEDLLEQNNTFSVGNTNGGDTTLDNISEVSIDHIKESSIHDEHQTTDLPVNHQSSWENTNQFHIQSPEDSSDIQESSDAPSISQTTIEHVSESNASNSQTPDANEDSQNFSQEVNQLPIKYLLESPGNLESVGKAWDTIERGSTEKVNESSIHDNSKTAQQPTTDTSVNYQFSSQRTNEFPIRLQEESPGVQQKIDQSREGFTQSSIEHITGYSVNRESVIADANENSQISFHQVNEPTINHSPDSKENLERIERTMDIISGVSSEKLNDSSVHSNIQTSDAYGNSQLSWKQENHFLVTPLPESSPGLEENIDEPLEGTNRANIGLISETNKSNESKIEDTSEIIQTSWQQENQFPIENIPLQSDEGDKQSSGPHHVLQLTVQRSDNFPIESLNKNGSHIEENTGSSIYHFNNNDQYSTQREVDSENILNHQNDREETQFPIEHITASSIEAMVLSTDEIRRNLNSSGAEASIDQEVQREHQYTDEIGISAHVISSSSGTSDGQSQYSDGKNNNLHSSEENNLHKKKNNNSTLLAVHNDPSQKDDLAGDRTLLLEQITQSSLQEQENVNLFQSGQVWNGSAGSISVAQPPERDEIINVSENKHILPETTTSYSYSIFSSPNNHNLQNNYFYNENSKDYNTQNNNHNSILTNEEEEEENQPTIESTTELGYSIQKLPFHYITYSLTPSFEQTTIKSSEKSESQNNDQGKSNIKTNCVLVASSQTLTSNPSVNQAHLPNQSERELQARNCNNQNQNVISGTTSSNVDSDSSTSIDNSHNVSGITYSVIRGVFPYFGNSTISQSNENNTYSNENDKQSSVQAINKDDFAGIRPYYSRYGNTYNSLKEENVTPNAQTFPDSSDHSIHESTNNESESSNPSQTESGFLFRRLQIGSDSNKQKMRQQSEHATEQYGSQNRRYYSPQGSHNPQSDQTNNSNMGIYASNTSGRRYFNNGSLENSSNYKNPLRLIICNRGYYPGTSGTQSSSQSSSSGANSGASSYSQSSSWSSQGTNSGSSSQSWSHSGGSSNYYPTFQTQGNPNYSYYPQSWNFYPRYPSYSSSSSSGSSGSSASSSSSSSFSSSSSSSSSSSWSSSSSFGSSGGRPGPWRPPCIPCNPVTTGNPVTTTTFTTRIPTTTTRPTTTTELYIPDGHA